MKRLKAVIGAVLGLALVLAGFLLGNRRKSATAALAEAREAERQAKETVAARQTKIDKEVDRVLADDTLGSYICRHAKPRD